MTAQARGEKETRVTQDQPSKSAAPQVRAGHPVGVQNRRRAPRTLRDVETADPTALAMMTRAQVDALGVAARTRRVEILLDDETTRWGLPEIMAFFKVGRSAVAKWRWRQRSGEPADGRRTALPEPLPELRHGGTGRPGAQWLMSTILRWGAEEADRADRHDYVPFPDGRKKPGRVPETDRTVHRVAPARRVRAERSFDVAVPRTGLGVEPLPFGSDSRPGSRPT